MSDPVLIRAYLENVLMALSNEQANEAKSLAQHAFELLHWAMPSASLHSSLPMPLTYSVGLDTGIRRVGRPNEDYAFGTRFVCRRASSPVPVVGGLFLIADGMGGHAKGADAAHLAIHTTVDVILPQLVSGLPLHDHEISTLLNLGVQTANQAIYLQNMSNQTAKMGTTITVAISLGTQLYVANVGDSRTYIYSANEGLTQVTRDHSLVARLVEEGAITPDEIYTHPKRNQIYRCLGEQATVETDHFVRTLQQDDVLLLCSDGLWEMLPKVNLIEYVLSRPLCVEEKVELLVQMARSAGGHDNIGVIVVHIPDVHDMPTILIPPVHIVELQQIASA